jgi:Lrp/AsnC family transcriptional regulator, leucine-responsive regulatory protein
MRRDGRVTMADLGEAVGLSSSAVHRRVKALEAAGVISGYEAVVDREALGEGFEVFVSVMLERTDPVTIAEFEAAVSAVPEVVSCHRLFGEPDYLLLVAVADLAAYETVWSGSLSALPGTSRVASQLTMKVVKR